MILVTGATGFVGKPLIAHLAHGGRDVVAVSRSGRPVEGAAETVTQGDILDPIPDEVLQRVDAVVHLAGIAHRGRAADPGEYDRVNNRGAVALAEAAAAAGVERFVFLSTAKVHGATSNPVFRSADRFDPPDAYSLAKAGAEDALAAMDGDMSIVRLRPPVVVGPDPKANVKSLAGLARRGLPLPIGRASSPRSMVDIDDLCRAVSAVLAHPGPVSGGYLVAHGEPLTTAELYSMMCRCFGTTPRSLPIGGGGGRLLDRLLEPVLGRRPLEPLYSPFEVDNASFVATFGCEPEVSPADSVARICGVATVPTA